MSQKWRISLLALVSLVGLGLAWGAVRAAVATQSSSTPTPAAPTPQALFNEPQDSPEYAAPGSDRQRDPINPEAPAISFIDSPSATCYLPRPGSDACYITWQYLYVSAGTSQYLISMTINISNQNRAYFAGFFQNQMTIPGDMLGKGFRVACGTPGSGSVPGFGRQYSYVIRARETGGLGAANYGSVTCPADQVPLQLLMLSGAGSGFTGADYTFIASVEPATVTLPITYVWQVSDYPVMTQTDGLNASQAFNWNTTGAKTVKVTAFNPVSLLERLLTILIEPYRIYFPLQGK